MPGLSCHGSTVNDEITARHRSAESFCIGKISFNKFQIPVSGPGIRTVQAQQTADNVSVCDKPAYCMCARHTVGFSH